MVLRPSNWLGLSLLALLVATGCATAPPSAALDPPDPPDPPAHSHAQHGHGHHAQTGYASYYARAHDGLRTASGERYDMDELTAAHRTLSFGTRVRVTNLENGRQVVVRINDRGPFRKGRVIDVSYAAARKLGLVHSGVAKVRVEVLGENVANEREE